MKFKSPIAWFEIVVKDMSKAKAFYEHVFQCQLTPHSVSSPSDNVEMEMALFPYDEQAQQPGGALVKSKCYDDHKNGASTTILYLNVDSINKALERITQQKGKVTFPCTTIGENGFIAGFEDLEGNAIGIWSMQA